jgi:ubiquinone/menaquinone biosynthesis C-methylase UbiE
MLEAEFDRFADEYRADHARNIRLSGEDPDFFASYKVADVQRIVGAAQSSKPLKILDFGAGVGNSIAPMRRHFPNADLTCLDVSERSLEIANRRFPNQAHFRSFDGHRIPFDDESFDLVFTACVFHHIPQPRQPGLLREIRRVLRQDGHFILFEHNPLNPLTRHAVNTCPFDENAVLIRAGSMRARIREAGFAKAGLAYRIFFPNALASLRDLERVLSMVPFGAQYYVHARKTQD